MNNSAHNNVVKENDEDFNIEEVEPVVAPDIGEEEGGTSIISVCRCS
jgi:hypothetical protein